MNEFLRKFDTIRFITPWSIFRNFLGIFHFLNSNLKFEFWPVGYRPEPEPDRTGLTGNRSNRSGYRRFGEPWLSHVVSLNIGSFALLFNVPLAHKVEFANLFGRSFTLRSAWAHRPRYIFWNLIFDTNVIRFSSFVHILLIPGKAFPTHL